MNEIYININTSVRVNLRITPSFGQFWIDVPKIDVFILINWFFDLMFWASEIRWIDFLHSIFWFNSFRWTQWIFLPELMKKKNIPAILEVVNRISKLILFQDIKIECTCNGLILNYTNFSTKLIRIDSKTSNLIIQLNRLIDSAV